METATDRPPTDDDDPGAEPGSAIRWTPHPTVISALVGLPSGVALVGVSVRAPHHLGTLTPLLILAVSVPALLSGVLTGRHRARVLPAAAGVVLGVLAFGLPRFHGDQPWPVVAGALGLLLVGLHRIVADVDRSVRPVSRGIGATLLAVTLVVMCFPGGWGIPLFTAFGVVWSLWSILVLTAAQYATARLGGMQRGHGDLETVRDWLHERQLDTSDRKDLLSRFLYGGPLFSGRLTSFVVLMILATIIATTGVVVDSTAVVIGAMVIAPMMTPLLGAAASLVMGFPTSLRRTTGVAMLGAVLAVGVAWGIGVLIPDLVDTATNPQILSRTNPTQLDLVIAVAAGAAGAFAVSRPDTSDSVAGVAIAISLVPPLAVTGLCYSQGDTAAGNGALLLFTVNALAIVIVGGVTLVLTGVTPLERVGPGQRRVSTAVAALLISSTVVTALVVVNGTEAAGQALRQGRVEAAVSQWAADGGHQVVSTVLRSDEVVVRVAGPGTGLPEVAQLEERIHRIVGQDIPVRVSVMIERPVR